MERPDIGKPIAGCNESDKLGHSFQRDNFTRFAIHDLPLSESENLEYYGKRLSDLKGGRRNRRARCPLHGGEGLNLAVDVETGLWYCHSQCGRGGDVFEFESLLNGGTFPEVKRRVYETVGRVDLDCTRYLPARFTNQQLADAEFFRIGLSWRIHRALDAVKEQLWKGGDLLVANEIAQLTAKTAAVEHWTMLESAESMLAADPELVAECRKEAQDAQFHIALGIRRWWQEREHT
jgi:CHC2 zinc finger